MIQKLNTRPGGFTLVEIMIVVTIIALLAVFATPSIMRARKRTQAGACKQDLVLVSDAVDQWATEKSKKTGDIPAWSDLKPYMKENSRLWLITTTPTDTLANPITIPSVGSPIAVPTATYSALSDAADATFWAPFTVTSGT